MCKPPALPAGGRDEASSLSPYGKEKSRSMDWKAGFDNAFSDVLKKRNLLVLALFWGAGLVLIFAYGTISSRPWGSRFQPPRAVPAQTRNETGTFGVSREPGQAHDQGAYKVTFSNLRAENAAAGIFRTASHKVAHIENLDVTFQRATPGDAGRLQEFCDLFAPRREGASKARSLGVLDELEAETADCSIPVDLANTTEVRIRDLDWKICCEGRTILSISCKYALLKSDASRVVLRGQATITTPHGQLKSNHVEMNVRDECFVVNGRYVVTRGQRRETGFAGRFDRMLRPLGVARSDFREDEKWIIGLQRASF
jgi:hypothetical protein